MERVLWVVDGLNVLPDIIGSVWPVLQPTTGGQTWWFCFTFSEPSCSPSFYIVKVRTPFFIVHSSLTNITAHREWVNIMYPDLRASLFVFNTNQARPAGNVIISLFGLNYIFIRHFFLMWQKMEFIWRIIPYLLSVFFFTICLVCYFYPILFLSHLCPLYYNQILYSLSWCPAECLRPLLKGCLAGLKSVSMHSINSVHAAYDLLVFVALFFSKYLKLINILIGPVSVQWL